MEPGRLRRITQSVMGIQEVYGCTALYFHLGST